MSPARALIDMLAPAIREQMDKGLSALVPGLAMAVTLIFGLGLILASAVMGLALLMGPILATGILGLGLLVAVALVGALRRKQTHQPHEQSLPEPSVAANPGDALPYLGFVLAFVATRTMMRRASQNHGD